MIGVLTHHWAKPNKAQEARELLDRNGLAQSKAPGFGRPADAVLAGRPHQNHHVGHLGEQRYLRRMAGQPGAGRSHGGGGGTVEPPSGVGTVCGGGVAEVSEWAASSNGRSMAQESPGAIDEALAGRIAAAAEEMGAGRRGATAGPLRAQNRRRIQG